MASENDSQRPRLLSLPVEILQRIAGYTTCSDIFSLFLTHRNLYAACNDRLLFKHIAENMHTHNQAKLSSEFIQASKWSDGHVLLHAGNLQDTIKTAYATERLLKITSGEDPLLEIRSGEYGYHLDFHEWLPHLIALRHPLTYSLSPIPYLNLFLKMGLKNKGRYQGASHLDSSADLPSLERFPHMGQTSQSQYQNLSSFDSSFTNLGFIVLATFLLKAELGVEVFTPLLLDVETTVHGDVFEGLVRNVPGNIEMGGVHSLDFVQCSAINVAMMGAILTNDFIVQAGNGSPLPLLNRTPLHEWMNVPPVYTESSVDTFSMCHVRKMVNPDFLAGNWEGYYSDHRAARRWRWFPSGLKLDAKMCNIRLNAREPGEGDIARLSRDFSRLISPGSDADLPMDEQGDEIKVVIDPSGGKDQHGYFTLSGFVSRQGEVWIVKTYSQHGWTWRWRGRVMPFGIVGAWGRFNEGGSFGGYFWIWKTEWTGF
ncbi:hypothetical protein CC78DRAFT_528896 [Lojkania enalia]|uniref:F-box domain-containing protein n=1 Tax=Lojkania enalia TaxID=147567 RepID=A0A9P4TPQ6_9PLEO|nr:hypothetical protein CC78DRAFT_528896 [Didymosphaeria enalia]